MTPLPIVSARTDVSLDRRHRLVDCVGNTPLLELKRISEEVAPVRIFGKAEWYNPGGSVKDRDRKSVV